MYFYNVWIEDRREYLTLGFYPNKDECPLNVLIHFTDFNMKNVIYKQN
jgi:hypothetical protein